MAGGEDSFETKENRKLKIIVKEVTRTLASNIAYLPYGQRAEKWIPSENKCTIFHYDQNGLLIAESTSSGNIKAEYVYLNGQPLAKIENNNIYYYHNDHLGSPQKITGGSRVRLADMHIRML